ncbi:hypothetical protein F5X99DRAFT_57925 [Biscogniauxia marginata]|nr:hypothetical protein F5X99DRAFT_57925 [Biscogniauxia marginata]
MDDTTRLASELLGKLAELDYKVNEYRHEMAQEFQRYSSQLLQHVPAHVRAQVEKVIAGEMQNYPALNLGHYRALDSPSTDDIHNAVGDQGLRCGKVTPPPTLPDTSSDLPSDGTRSPHEREREFIGLFTPSYLPLLEAVQRRDLASTPTPATPTSPSQGPESNGSSSTQSLTSPSLGNIALSRPDPVRRHTGDTVSSVTSDDSASRTRRSALRRSSNSSTKTQSPRRVRFDVEGEEVLPTVSPPISPRTSDLPSFSQSSPTRMLDDSYGEIVLDDETGLLGSSPPRPKKLTSTDRLKALARNSNEDTSTWTVVGNSQALYDDEEDELVMPSLNGHSQAATLGFNVEGAGRRINDVRLPAQTSPSLEVVHEIEEDQYAGDDDEMSDILEMPPLSSFKGKKRFSPPQDIEAGIEHNASETQERNNTLSCAIDPRNSCMSKPLDEEDMFQFDDGRDDASDSGDRTKTASKYIDEEEDEEDEEDEGEATPVAEDQTGNPPAVLYSRSPGVPIAKPPPPAPAPAPASTPSKHISASTGSYKGKPFTIGIVRDQEMHKRAAEMGQFNSFVGSVDGRSGVDESSSYRPDPASFNGTPRSLSERLMKEELEAAYRDSDIDKQD